MQLLQSPVEKKIPRLFFTWVSQIIFQPSVGQFENTDWTQSDRAYL